MRANSRKGAVGAHPGTVDRMVGNKPSRETGPSNPQSTGAHSAGAMAVMYGRVLKRWSNTVPRPTRRRRDTRGGLS